MANEFFTILTATGKAKLAAAQTSGTPLQITQMAVGDGDNGAYYNPVESQTALKHETWRGALNNLSVDQTNPNWIVAELVIPDTVGGFYIREVGLFDSTGALIAVGKFPESYKPTLAAGSNKQLYVRMILEVSNASAVTLLVDPSVVLATKAAVDQRIAEELAKLDGKPSVKVATTAAIALTGLQTIDGVALAAGDRVLVKDQVAAKDNGIYVVAAGVWARAADADASIEVTPGLFVAVEQGTANAYSIWHLVTNAPITLGTTGLSFEMVKGKTGATAGTYKRVTVNALGQVIGGDNPTTLADMGIDAPLVQPFFMPEIIGPSGNKLSITASAGQIVVDAASQIIWRGTRVYDVASYSVAARTFATVVNKTYHLRWRPSTGFVLLDLANAAYNHSAQAETAGTFDSQPDDALIATVVTSAGNVPTVTPYDNLAIYTPKVLVDMFSNTRLVTSGDTVLMTSNFTQRHARSYRGRIDWDLWLGANINLMSYGHPRIEFDGVKVGHGTRWHVGFAGAGYAYNINYSGHRIQTLNRGNHTIRAMFRNETSSACVVFNPGQADAGGAGGWENSGSSLSVTAVEVI